MLPRSLISWVEPTNNREIPMAKEIQLTQGKVTIVDDEDYEALAGVKWLYLNRGYAARFTYGPKRELLYMHRVITNAPAGLQADHINGDKLDNRRSNLRLCTDAQNQQNRRKWDGNYTSQYKGVSWYPRLQKWVAQIAGHHLGYFADEAEAALAYDRIAREHFGEFAWLNFPDVTDAAA
jgi:hypothetical protein